MSSKGVVSKVVVSGGWSYLVNLVQNTDDWTGQLQNMAKSCALGPRPGNLFVVLHITSDKSLRYTQTLVKGMFILGNACACARARWTTPFDSNGAGKVTSQSTCSCHSTAPMDPHDEL